MDYSKLDIGCGSTKKAGTIGVDVRKWPGVDVVADIENDKLPFPDESVDYVFSSHCLEHLSDPVKAFKEISRVCIDGATLEFWTPYNWSNSGFIFDHKFFPNEDHYYHIGVYFPEFWAKSLGCRWLIKEFGYVVEPHVLKELRSHNVPLDFAIKYYKNVVKEFLVRIEVRRNYDGDIVIPERTYATDRSEARKPIPTWSKPTFLGKLRSFLHLS